MKLDPIRDWPKRFLLWTILGVLLVDDYVAWLRGFEDTCHGLKKGRFRATLKRWWQIRPPIKKQPGNSAG